MSSITKEDCEEVMKKSTFKDGQQFLIQSFTIEPFSAGVSHHSFIFQLTINCKVNNELSINNFFVKSATEHPEIFNKYWSKMNVFYTEHVLHGEILKILQKEFPKKFAPECYLTRLNEVLIMEDMTQDGYELCKTPNLDLEHIELALKCYANFHAACIIYEEKHGTSLLDKYEHVLFENFGKQHKEYPNENVMSSTDIGCRALFSKFFPGIPKKYLDSVFDTVLDKAENMPQPSKQYRNVICHGDPWIRNILFKYEDNHPVDAVLVDFQMCRTAPPALDFTQIVYIASPKTVRVEYFDKLKDIYYNELERVITSNGIDMSQILSRDDFYQSFNYYEDFGVCMKLYYDYGTEVPLQYMEPLFNNSEAFLVFMRRGDSTYTENAFENDLEFRKLLTDTFVIIFERFGNINGFNPANIRKYCVLDL